MDPSTADRAADLMRRAVTRALPLRRLARLLRSGAAELAAALERDDRFRLLHTRPTLTPALDPAGGWSAAYNRVLATAGLGGSCVVMLADPGPDPVPSAVGLLADTMTRLLPRDQSPAAGPPPIPPEAFAEAALALALVAVRGRLRVSPGPGARSTIPPPPSRPGP